MEITYFYKTAGYFSGFRLNRLMVLLTLCFAFSLYAENEDTGDVQDGELLDKIPVEESIVLDTSVLLQPNLNFQEFQAPPPKMQPIVDKSSFLTVGLSALFPGLGHVYLGDMKTAGGLMGNTGISMGGVAWGKSDPFVESTSFLALQTTWLYGIYAAYRDVRIHNRQSGYSYTMPTDSFWDLAAAPFNPKVLKKPEVWGGFLASLAIAFTTAFLAFPAEEKIHSVCSLSRSLAPLTAFPIGVGEESFFRGFLQSQFSEWLSPWGGILLSSTLFGLAHISNADDLEPGERKAYYSHIVPLIALSGIYDGWLTFKNHSLKESVAIHAWYDFVLFTIGAIAGDSVVKVRPTFAIAIPF